MEHMEPVQYRETKHRSLYYSEEKKCSMDSSSTSTSNDGVTTTSDSDSRSKKSHMSQSEMNEAYRRLGHKLSLRVHGTSFKKTASIKIKCSSRGAFETFSRGGSIISSSMSTHGSSLDSRKLDSTSSTVVTWSSYDRTPKVAKTHLKDHGEHHPQQVSGSILKRITCHAKENLRSSSPFQKGGKKRTSPQTTPSSKKSTSPLVSPQRHALSKLALGNEESSSALKGLLHSVSEGETNNAASAAVLASTSTEELKSKSAPPAVLTEEEDTKCLTNPPDPVDNDGLDNVEGNLIVHKSQVLRINARTFENENRTSLQLKVVGLLGQGTFAQVFQCLDLKTNKMVALKVVKNRSAYTRQAAVEIDVFYALRGCSSKNMVQLLSYCMHQNHLCLVFELLGLNLYEVLKRRQFRGLPIKTVRSLLQRATEGIKELCQANIVHCDLKPENILLSASKDQSIKLIDFGSACFEGHSSHTYIQSRFYRSPEVLLGLPYDSAIDMWSLGCVAAELFLGLPILPGVHEHDQLMRICEMIGPVPDKMLDQGSKSSKHFSKYFPKNATSPPPRTPPPGASSTPSPPALRPSWRIKTLDEYIQGLTPEEIRKKGGLEKLQKQPTTNRYFKRKRLSDIVMLYGNATSPDEMEQLQLFVHFLMGILDPDPWKRWTALQASSHPFLTGSNTHRRKSTSDDKEKKPFDIYWVPPWDPAVCKRRLMHVQKTREKQQQARRRSNAMSRTNNQDVVLSPSGAARVSSVAEQMTLLTKASSAPQGEPLKKKGGSPPTAIGAPQQDQQQVSYSGPIQYRGIAAPTLGRTTSGNAVPAGSLHHSENALITSGMAPPPFVANSASSLSDAYHHNAMMSAAMMQMPSPSMHGIPVPAPIPQPPYAPRAQSYTGLGGQDAVHNMPMEAELGYALQRPGVVPSIGEELPATPVMMPHLGGGVPQFSPHPSVARSVSSNMATTPSSVGRNGHRRRRHTFNAPGTPTTPQSPYMHGGYTPSSTTSIREDGADLPDQEDKMEANGDIRTTSLLSQQLAQHSEGSSTSRKQQEASEVQYHHAQQRQQQLMPAGYGMNHAAMYGPQAAMLQQQQQQQQQQMNVFYYISVDGRPVVVPPQNISQLPVYGSHGSFQDYGIMAQHQPQQQFSAPVQQQQPIPPHLAQPSFEEMEMHQRQQQMQAAYWSGAVPPLQQRPPQHQNYYGGMSM